MFDIHKLDYPKQNKLQNTVACDDCVLSEQRKDETEIQCGPFIIR